MIVSRIWALALLPLATPAIAQLSQAELVTPQGVSDLNGHLARLASNPRDTSALIGAGESALALDDPHAAAGFFARADALESGNGRIKAGLGRVMLRLQNPGEALRLFDQATRLGYPETGFLSDRGLARDLTGDQAGAQRDYQVALRQTPDDAELIRRYAASLGIAGQVAASDRVLQPLLYKSDRSAWRYRAFILAMNNQQADAQKMAAQTMPAPLAAAITPYMLKMPYLTPAQKAAAVHYGHFPTQVASRIEKIVPTPPAFAETVVKPPVVVAEATPKGRRDRSSRRSRDRQTGRTATLASAPTAIVQPPPPVPPAPEPPVAQQPASTPPVRTAQATVQPRVESRPTPPPATGQGSATQAAPIPAPSAQTAVVQPLPAQGRGTDTPSAPVRSAPQESVPASAASAPAQAAQAPAPGLAADVAPFQASPQAPVQGPTLEAEAGPPTPGYARATADVAAPAAAPPQAATAPVPSTPTPASQPAPNPEATRSLADIIRAIDVPDSEKQASVVAVDLAEIARLQEARRTQRIADQKVAAEKAKKAAAAKAEADAKKKEEARLAANPSRNWLQIATGADKGALGFTLKAMRKKYADIAPQSAWTAAWGKTNRLVVGPFSGFARAKALEEKLKGQGADVFAWQSEAGEEVTRMPSGS